MQVYKNEFSVQGKKILLGCDLDRTIIPNGIQKESPLARPLLRHLVQYPHIYLAYVSGRDQNLIRDAIDEFYLPMPDYAIGNVGTTLYRTSNDAWQLSDDWSDEIGQDWKRLGWERLSELLEDEEDIRLQEPERQNRYKASYYAEQNVNHQRLMTDIRRVLAENGVRARLIWSVDEIDKNGMNGNYAAGVIEGLAHYISETQELIAEAVERMG